MEIVNGNGTSIVDLLVGFKRCWVIPPFQRNYSWDTEQCEELYEDLVKSVLTKKPHYLGNIVSYPGENDSAGFSEKILVDGQQRLTTLLLLICAIKDTIADDDLKEDLMDNYLINKGKNDKRVRLKQTSNDAVVFEAIINGTINMLDVDKRNNHLIENYNKFVELLKQETRINDKNDLLDAIVKAEVIDITLINNRDLNTIQTIFEKINHTGKPLTSGDLIRNYLLLAKSSIEQLKLYNNYWVNIEKNNIDISKFSKVYYILDSLDILEEENIYITFRDYYNGNKKEHETILKEMLELSNYYLAIEDNTINDEEIKRNIKYLKKLKYDDMIPLLVYLYEKTANNDLHIKEFKKILDLLVDFMFRYRIVKPYTGGTPLKKIVQNLLVKLTEGEIKINYDDIIFELSNSAEPNQKFPNDKEFAESLMSGDKDKYKREVLLRLEDKETKNIRVDVDNSDITLEHLMPQAKSNWWIENMGGDDSYALAIEKYLNSIGNLALLSRGYNAVNSNDPWNEKLIQLSVAQFQVTQEVSNFKEWKEEEILNRNENLAKRICNVITSPLQRTRQFDTIKTNDGVLESFEAGVYNLNDTTFPENSISIKKFIIDNINYNVNSWRDFFNKLCSYLYGYKYSEFEKIVKENLIHKKNKNEKYNYDPIITSDKNALQKALNIEGTNYYTEGTLSENRVLYYARKLVNEIKFDKEIELDLYI